MTDDTKPAMTITEAQLAAALQHYTLREAIISLGITIIPDALAVDPLLAKAREIAAEVWRQEGSSGVASEVVEGECDSITSVQAAYATLQFARDAVRDAPKTTLCGIGTFTDPAAIIAKLEGK